MQSMTSHFGIDFVNGPSDFARQSLVPGQKVFDLGMAWEAAEQLAETRDEVHPFYVSLLDVVQFVPEVGDFTLYVEDVARKVAAFESGLSLEEAERWVMKLWEAHTDLA